MTFHRCCLSLEHGSATWTAASIHSFIRWPWGISDEPFLKWYEYVRVHLSNKNSTVLIPKSILSVSQTQNAIFWTIMFNKHLRLQSLPMTFLLSYTKLNIRQNFQIWLYKFIVIYSYLQEGQIVLVYLRRYWLRGRYLE